MVQPVDTVPVVSSSCGARCPIYQHKIGEDNIMVQLRIVVDRDAQCQRPDWQ